VFVLERLDQDTATALAEIGERSVLCKPIHREQLEATCLLALKQQEKATAPVQVQEPARAEAAQTRERHLEKTLRRIAEAVAVSGIGIRGDNYGVAKLDGLRPREEEIVRLLLQHVRVPAIAQRLGINQQTVRNHLKGAFKRTGVRSQQELLDYFAGTVREA
jgi:DNA-binding CsgD family transcriptional regulator